MNPGFFNSPQRCRERERLGWRSLQATGALALALAFGVRTLPPTGTDGIDDGGSIRETSIVAILPAPPLPTPDSSSPLTPSHPHSFPLSSPPAPDIRPAQIPPLPPCPDSSPLPLTALPESEVPPSPPAPLFEADFRPEKAVPSAPAPPPASAIASKVTVPAFSSATARTHPRTADSSSPLPGKDTPTRAARYRSTPHPPYPPLLREQHIEGSVRVRILVDSSGRPTAVDILTGSGHAAFDDTAQRWILNHWTFYPAERNGRAVPGRVITHIHFVMK